MPSFGEHIQQAADRYIAGLESGALQPNRTLVNAMVNQAIDEWKSEVEAGEQATLHGEMTYIPASETTEEKRPWWKIW